MRVKITLRCNECKQRNYNTMKPPPVNRFLQKNPVFFAVSSHFLLLPAVILCMIEPI